MKNETIKNYPPPPEKLSYPHNHRKLLPFLFIAEAGLAGFQIGYCISGVGSVILWLGVVASIAAIVFTILYALNIKPRLAVAAIMICVAFAILLLLLTSTIGNLSSAAYYKTQLLPTADDETTREVFAQSITRYTLIGSASLVFAVALLPLSVYLPIWFLRRPPVSE